MSLPPLNPEKTASGIIVDPRTLERVIPQSKRKDGTVRKEQKVRPGFTPQEDVGRFRSTRQTQEDVRSASKPTIPGSNRLGPQIKSTTENVFASEPREKTKAQIKNEKRREKKREKVSVSWDEDDDDDVEDEKLDEAFKQGDKQRELSNGNTTGTVAGAGAEQDFPPISDEGGIPQNSVLDDLKQREEDTKSGKTAALEPTPPAASHSPEETSLKIEQQKEEQKHLNDKPSLLNDRKNELDNNKKPHPIQGGRKGPIGLANPPPIEEERANPSKADQDDWRTVRKPKQFRNDSNTSERGGRGGARGGGRGGGRGGKSQNPRSNGNTNGQPKPAASAPPAPRERKEYKVREGGANDISSLAARVKNLVVANTVGNAPKEKKEEPKPSA